MVNNIMTNWQEVKLGDIAIITMGQSPKSEFYNSIGEGLPFLQGNRTFGLKYPIFDTYTTNLTKIAEAGDIIMSVRAPVGDLNITPQKLCLGRGVCSLRMKNGNQAFLYYLMKYNNTSLLNRESGTVFGSVNKNDIESLMVNIPDPDVQRRIAGVLGALDDKIELNNKINQNLESQAQTLFNEQILKNTTLGKIGDYCSLKSGFAFKSSWWKDSGIKVIKIKNIEVSGLNLKDCSFVSDDKITLAKDFIVKGGDLLIAMTGATIGKFTIVPYVDEILLVNQRVGKFFLGDNPLKRLPFIYCTLKQPEIVSEIINRGQGSAQPNISGNDIMSISCIYPNNSVIEEFNNICKPYFEKIITNQYENMKLSAIRDALLPKLMSGEIDVENLPQSAIIPKE